MIFDNRAKEMCFSCKRIKSHVGWECSVCKKFVCNSCSYVLSAEYLRLRDLDDPVSRYIVKNIRGFTSNPVASICYSCCNRLGTEGVNKIPEKDLPLYIYILANPSAYYSIKRRFIERIERLGYT